MHCNFKTDLLTATSTFIIGMGSVMNLGGNYFNYNSCPTAEEADRIALASDWAMTGQDIRAELDELKRQHEK